MKITDMKVHMIAGSPGSSLPHFSGCNYPCGELPGGD